MQYDNLCKYLAEKYPQRFASWVLGRPVTGVQVLKTELSIEPIRADSIILLRLSDRILHLEFQVSVPGPKKKPMPLRMLNYWVRLHWQYGLPVTQVLIWLVPTSNPAVFEDFFELESTWHDYQVVRMWEQSPSAFLQEPALLPFATLAAHKDSAQLLGSVVAAVDKIKLPEVREEISTCTQLLAGLRHQPNLIRSLFAGGIMRESLVYQEILQEGKQEGAMSLVTRLLSRRFGPLSEELSLRIRLLSTTRLESLGEALLDFEKISDLIAWLDRT
ncbi:MAG: Rpn family recombination-promoting nuclease/putative transposase [Oscillatoria sp. SIO1A7]|nr:Rpn family recombination-promoting nuclease/putative transposase [Oscillatoria sp. SIO1A7]